MSFENWQATRDLLADYSPAERDGELDNWQGMAEDAHRQTWVYHPSDHLPIAELAVSVVAVPILCRAVRTLEAENSTLKARIAQLEAFESQVQQMPPFNYWRDPADDELVPDWDGATANVGHHADLPGKG